MDELCPSAVVSTGRDCADAGKQTSVCVCVVCVCRGGKKWDLLESKVSDGNQKWPKEGKKIKTNNIKYKKKAQGLTGRVVCAWMHGCNAMQ